MLKRFLSFILILMLALLPAVSVNALLAYGEHQVLYGDLTCDQAITADDALEILRIAVSKPQAEDRFFPAGDVDADGNLTAADGLLILKLVVGKLQFFAAGEYATVHKWGEWQTVREATETQTGLLERHCAYCDATDREELPMLTKPLGEQEQQVLNLVNAERAKEGLSPLAYYTAGQSWGDVRANELNALFDHTRPDGSSCFTVIPDGVSWYILGENIAMGQVTAQQVMESWMNSQGHRDNIMNPKFTHIIVGVVPCEHAGYRGYCWVQLFLGLHG